MPPKVSTRSKAVAPAQAPTAATAASSTRAPVQVADNANTTAMEEDPDLADYDLDEIMADVQKLASDPMPTTPGQISDASDDDDSEDAEPEESDQALLERLQRERQELNTKWQTATRKMARKTATYEEAKAAEALVLEKDEEIAMLNRISGTERPQEEKTTTSAPEKKGNDDQLILKVPKDTPRFNTGSNVRQFLVGVKDSITAYVGQERFERDCQRYLCFLTQSPSHRRQLDDELDARKGEKLTWKELETLFLRIAMPVRERMDEIRNIIGLGRKSNETYRQFALRINHDVTMLGIKDDNEVIIDSLMDKVPDTVYNDMLLMLRMEKKSRCHFTSIKDFTDILSDMAGPTMD
ncbi:hypothetical protein BGZ72_002883, partial [Mortierella alpina]